MHRCWFIAADMRVNSQTLCLQCSGFKRRQSKHPVQSEHRIWRRKQAGPRQDSETVAEECSRRGGQKELRKEGEGKLFWMFTSVNWSNWWCSWAVQIWNFTFQMRAVRCWSQRAESMLHGGRGIGSWWPELCYFRAQAIIFWSTAPYPAQRSVK